ncbi:hypothetical protein OG883_00775 [Streptomyces sp. NBC_01142]|uniref:hypothetical protein n=1 Tax=Streptomyces sp. NBC_01142 TaxID=2975865 RepID=UPI002252ED95|nr:hypothetical protein [Streptomyces sp. NBC_01142]MCX4818464.1 hypothetical protein [Streptomyces sp. NBC_01142]
MNAMHQHMIDNYRAYQHGEQAPPQPGRHDWQMVREVRDYRRLQATLKPRRSPKRLRSPSRLRTALTRALRLHRRPADCT